jgi:EPS-associated MarR family transcriptional regulator
MLFNYEHAVSFNKRLKRGMKQTEKTFQVLDALHREEISTQRQLAEISGISLGQVNYILKSLLEKGLVKVGNFRKNPHKIGYAYLLTPRGLEEKSKLAVKFVVRKLREYEILRDRITRRLVEIEKAGHSRIIFVGPSMVKEFITSIIKDKNMQLILIGHHEDSTEIDDIKPDAFDVAISFDEDLSNKEMVENSLTIPKEKLLYLW